MALNNYGFLNTVQMVDTLNLCILGYWPNQQQKKAQKLHSHLFF